MSNKKVECPTCGIPEKDQHSLRQGGQCDFLRSIHQTYATPKGAELLKVLQAGGRVKLS